MKKRSVVTKIRDNQGIYNRRQLYYFRLHLVEAPCGMYIFAIKN
jgi:hypothetical protein